MLYNSASKKVYTRLLCLDWGIYVYTYQMLYIKCGDGDVSKAPTSCAVHTAAKPKIILEQFQAALPFGEHDESQYYGPRNLFLNGLFPCDNQYKQ